MLMEPLALPVLLAHKAQPEPMAPLALPVLLARKALPVLMD